METPIETKGSSNRDIRYTCSQCKRAVGRANLKVKQVQFKEMGLNGSVIRKRVTEWLCITDQDDGTKGCLYLDPVWNQPPLSGAPGMADTRLAQEGAA